MRQRKYEKDEVAEWLGSELTTAVFAACIINQTGQIEAFKERCLSGNYPDMEALNKERSRLHGRSQIIHELTGINEEYLND